MTSLGVNDITEFLDRIRFAYKIEGSCENVVDGYMQLNSIEENKITWVRTWSDEIDNRLKYFKNLIVVCNTDAIITGESNCYILCNDPKACFFEILGEFYAKKERSSKISEKAEVETDKIGSGCSIGAFSHIGSEVELGENVQIANNVTITGRVKIGNNVRIASGAVIGKAGYGYYLAQDGHRKQVPHLGGVVIGDHVEIGANSCIDRGTMGDTVIGEHTKIDNLCHIGHNVQIGKDVMIVAGTAIGGSTVIGDGTYIAPGAVVKNQLQIGKNVFVGMQSVVARDVNDEESVFGVPARAMKRDYKI